MQHHTPHHIRYLLPRILLLVALCACILPPATAEHPWVLPLITGGATDLHAGAQDWLELHRGAAFDDGWRSRLGATSEDTLRVRSGDEDTRLSATGWELSLRGDDAATGHLRYTGSLREISLAYRTATESTTLLMDAETHRVLLATPPVDGWRAGLEISSLETSGDGTTSLLSGLIGNDPQPRMEVALAQRATLLRLERALGRGGVFVVAGPTTDRTTLTLVDTHRQQATLSYEGQRYLYGAWAPLGRGTLELTLVAGNADASDLLLYDGAENGQTSGTQSLRQGQLTYATKATTYSLGYADFAMRQQGFGVKPNTNGFTIIANGTLALESRFGEVTHRWALRRGCTLDAGYQLHRLRLDAGGRYRAGYVGGLLETDRGSGMATERAWLHYLTLDVSAPIRHGRLGYRGQVTVPLIDDDGGKTRPPSAGERTKTRGGLAHTLYWEQLF